ncbi:lysostaphin resistance A-like protein [Bacteroidota bacterium]
MEKILTSWWKRIIIFLLLLILIYIPISNIKDLLYSPSGFYSFWFSDSLTLLFCCLIASAIIEGFRAERNFATFGILITKQIINDFIIAFSVVIIPFALLAVLFNLLELNTITDYTSFSVFLWVAYQIFILVAFEELIFRGIIFQALLDRFGIIVTLLITSLFFAVVHFGNPNYTLIPFLNTFLAGILLGIMYIQTKSLYLPIFYHFFWNYSQQVLLGSNLSGYQWDVCLLRTDWNSLPQWLYGGSYGIEGGLASTLILLITIPIILKYAKTSPYISSKLLKREIFESFFQ